MLHSLLKNLGLSEKEAVMYLAMLHTGQATASTIASAAKQNRGTAYNVLEALVTKGFAEKITEGKILCFSAIEPQQLTHVLEQKKKEIEQSTKALQAILKTYENTEQNMPRIHLFHSKAVPKTIQHYFRKEKKLLQICGKNGMLKPIMQKAHCAYSQNIIGTILIGKQYVFFCHPNGIGVLIQNECIAHNIKTAFQSLLSAS